VLIGKLVVWLSYRFLYGLTRFSVNKEAVPTKLPKNLQGLHRYSHGILKSSLNSERTTNELE
jgi:hypothetical protein